MHVDRQRRRTDDKRAHAGDQRRAALGRTDTRSPRGTAAMRRRDEREILRRGVRRDLPGSEREAAPGVGSALRNDGHYGRIRPAWARPARCWGGRAGIACILGTGSNSCLLPTACDILRNVAPAGLGAGRRRQRGRASAGNSSVNGMLQGLCDESAAPAVSRGGAARTTTRSSAASTAKPDGQPLSWPRSRAFVRAAHRPPRDSTNWSAKSFRALRPAQPRARYPAERRRVGMLGGVACSFRTAAAATRSQPEGCARGRHRRIPRRRAY